MHLTTLWHVKLALPWNWNAAPGDTSERGDLRQMVGSLPALSTTKLLDTVRDALIATRDESSDWLADCLSRAQLDSYERTCDRRSRHYPRQNKPNKCGSPVIRPPKHEERTKLKSLIRKGFYCAIAV